VFSDRIVYLLLGRIYRPGNRMLAEQTAAQRQHAEYDADHREHFQFCCQHGFQDSFHESGCSCGN